MAAVAPNGEVAEAEPLLEADEELGPLQGDDAVNLDAACNDVAPENDAQDAPPAEPVRPAEVIRPAETLRPAEVLKPPAAADATPSAAEIFTLTRQQNFGVAVKLLEAYPEHWTALDDEGHSLLHWGALVGNQEFVKLGLGKGCPVDTKAHNAQTPLMWAVLRGHVQATRALLDAKASVTHRDSLGATSLMIAIQHRSYQAMLVLMNRGKALDLPMVTDSDKNGCTAGHWAAYKGDLLALRLLDYFGANLSATDNSQMQPLHRAVCASQASVIEFLLEKQCDPQARNADGKTPLEIAEGQEDLNMQQLIKKLSQKVKLDSGSSNKGLDKDVEKGESDEKKKEEKKEGFMKSILQDKAAQKAFPVFWLICVSMALFEYLMDMRAISYEAAPTSALLFELGVPASLALFFYVALTDPGKVPARTKGHSGVEELMKALDGGVPEARVPDITRLCTSTWVLKDLRTKYCTQTGACVSEFDHYCVWLNTSIGRGNHRHFFGLAVTEWLTQLCFVYAAWCSSLKLVPYQSFGTWIFGVVTAYPLLFIIVLLQCLTIPWVLMLIIHQVRLVSMNLTTNEMMNMYRYDHFWVQEAVMPGRVSKAYRNPFHKGSLVKNWIDFWWTRRRSLAVNWDVPAKAKACGSGCNHDHGSGHDHGHGHGHGHSHG